MHCTWLKQPVSKDPVKAEYVNSYVAQISKAEQINLQKAQTSDLGAGAEIALNALVMTISLVLYAAGITKTAWEAAPAEGKDAFVKRLGSELPGIITLFRKKK
ncbi:hypothetical protein BO78DRAFT_422156 [Aspergillus sclerotiicarbonarius CBS 121057]|uniref:Uncharacterized protein n=1 Tax=Aspergillus sclerotiicarbonarius (strain CBS 121057 / IBT 28362) TaxID=1448318 RepID=A0A319E8E4_ASPSB|nr:hypothetical protein BO78DRAFT_422156 [Aspergillus sclerotiicarbonarius CBS 121057]